MKADYSRIASKYDRTRAREPIGMDSVLTSMVEASGKEFYRALDLGCGTGNYLCAQIEQGPSSVRWDALDASLEMLDVARKKIAAGVTFTHGKAEDLQYEDETFDFVMLRAVFHHLQNKEQGLNEIFRVLKPGGHLHIVNGAYEYRPGHWVYQYFPSTWAIDQTRFWSVDRLFKELQARGMRPEANVTFRRYYEPRSEVLLWATNRDLSPVLRTKRTTIS